LNAQGKDGFHTKDADPLSPEELTLSNPSAGHNTVREDGDWVERVGRRSSVNRASDYSAGYNAIGVKRRRTSEDQGQFTGPKLQDTGLNNGVRVRVSNAYAAVPPLDPLLGSHAHHLRTNIPTEGDRSPATNAIDKQIDGIIDRITASNIFNHYVSDMAVHLPAVVFEPGTTAVDVRAQKPILFLAILVAASVGMTDLRVQHNLSQMTLGVFADAIIRSGKKSLELVQALIVSAIWYRPPKRYEQMNFYQLTHIAAVMAIDIGMGKKLNPSKTWRMQTNDQARAQKHIQASDTVEARRTWMGCYFLCAK